MAEYRSKETFGVFVFAGYAPATETVKGIIQLNEQGYIVTDKSQKTSTEGVYAAGDVCIKPLRQVVTATSDGALAATELEKYAAALQRKTGLHPEIPTRKKNEVSVSVSHAETSANSTALFTAQMQEQLDTVFSRMERKLLLKLYLDNRPISAELEGFITALVDLSDKLTVEVADRQASESYAPCVKICLEDGSETGLAFHGVPSGHEFTSFVLGLYNAAGPGQPIDEDTRNLITAITKPTDMKILVTLSCTMCPDLVKAAQQIAAENPLITAEVYDIHHFEDIKERFNVMSVPCLVINDEKISFGKKIIRQILDLLAQL